MSTGQPTPARGQTDGVQTTPKLGPVCSGCGGTETHYLGRTDEFICQNCRNVMEYSHA